MKCCPVKFLESRGIKLTLSDFSILAPTRPQAFWLQSGDRKYTEVFNSGFLTIKYPRPLRALLLGINSFSNFF